MFKESYTTLLFIGLFASIVSQAEEVSLAEQLTKDYLVQKQQIDQLNPPDSAIIQLQKDSQTNSYPWLSEESPCFTIKSVDLNIPKSVSSLDVSDFYKPLKILKKPNLD